LAAQRLRSSYIPAKLTAPVLRAGTLQADAMAAAVLLDKPKAGPLESLDKSAVIHRGEARRLGFDLEGPDRRLRYA
jgi:hypothetical protein